MRIKDIVIYTNVSELYMDENEIVHIVFPERGLNVGEKDIQEIFQGRMAFPTRSSKQMVLADLRNNPNLNGKTIEYVRSIEMITSTKALAMIYNNPIAVFFGNLFIILSMESYPIKLFTDEDEAAAWLLFST